MRKLTPLEDVQSTINILKQKPEIDEKVKYYKSVLTVYSKIINSLDEKIKSGGKTEVMYFMGVLPIVKKNKLDNHEIAKLELELVQTEAQLQSQKNYFEMWLQRSKEYETKFDEVTRDCNNNWDSIMKYAEEVRKTNFRLAQVMDNYSNPDNNEKTKVEYYLYVKRECENYIQANNKKLVSKNA